MAERIIATGPIPGGSRAAQFGEQLGGGLGLGVGAIIGQGIQERRQARQLNPLREALMQSIPQVGSGVQMSPQQQMVAQAAQDPRQFARLAQRYGPLELAAMFEQQQQATPAYKREIVVRHDSELAQRFNLGLQPGDTATVKLSYDAQDNLLPGHEIEQFSRASEAGDDESNLFGTGLRGRSLEYIVNFAEGFAEGRLTPEQERVFITSAYNYRQPETFTDPDTGLPVTRRAELPPYAVKALQMRGYAVDDEGIKPPLGSPPAGQVAVSPEDQAIMQSTEQAMPTVPSGDAFLPQSGRPTLWEMFGSGDVTGPIAMVARGLHRIPGNLLGKFPEQTEAYTYVTGIKEQLINGLRINPRYAEGEATRLFKSVDINPKMFDSASSGQSVVIGFDDVLEDQERHLSEVVSGKRALVSGETRQHAMDSLQQIRYAREILAPPRMRSLQQAQEFIRTSTPGTKFLFQEDGNWVQYEVEPR